MPWPVGDEAEAWVEKSESKRMVEQEKGKAERRGAWQRSHALRASVILPPPPSAKAGTVCSLPITPPDATFPVSEPGWGGSVGNVRHVCVRPALALRPQCDRFTCCVQLERLMFEPFDIMLPTKETQLFYL